MRHHAFSVRAKELFAEYKARKKALTRKAAGGKTKR
jgi:hypothetical protein